MQPAAARVGPSNEPSVRKIAVRFSSGATICIEKTIKGLVLSVVSNTRTSRSSSQEARQVTMRTGAAGKYPSKQRARKLPGRDGDALRRRLSSETSEEAPKFRSRMNAARAEQMPSKFLRG